MAIPRLSPQTAARSGVTCGGYEECIWSHDKFLMKRFIEFVTCPYTFITPGTARNSIQFFILDTRSNIAANPLSGSASGIQRPDLSILRLADNTHKVVASLSKGRTH